MIKNTIRTSLLVSVIIDLVSISVSQYVVQVPEHLHNLTNPDRNIKSDENDAGRTTPGFTTAVPNSVRTTTPVTRERHPCNRQCRPNEPMICSYDFHIEHYQTMSKACYECPFNVSHCDLKDCIAADGVKRTITVVNRQFPGPSIEVCLGDTIHVVVRNSLFDETTSIHWHGIHQRSTPFMDGVPKITQCPIHPGTTFAYRFNASNPGTHFWHSHSGLQRSDGVFGSLIVRVPLSQDQYSEFYDYDLSEHVMNIMDWIHVGGLPKFISHYHSDGDNKPTGILVNGKGRYQEFEDEFGRVLHTPVEKFSVKQGFKYRFRLINSGSLNCPIEVSVDNHTMVIINSDGEDLEAVEAQSLVNYAGERFDFIMEMNQDVDNYWIRYKGLMDCDERFRSVFQVAILHYEGAPEDSDPSGEIGYDIMPEGLGVNTLNAGLNSTNSLIMAELRSTKSSRKDPRLKPNADFKFYVAYDFYRKDNSHYHKPLYYGFNQTEKSQQILTPQLNHISMKFPAFPLMLNLKEASQLPFCNSSSLPQHCTYNYCECMHLLKVPKNAVVEIILIDEGFAYDANHPFHLHGYSFRVIGMDRLGNNVTKEKIQDIDKKGLLMRNLKEAPIKDTVTVPDGGYTIIRFLADNPGYWLFHCHIEFHMELGMALIFKVGEDSDYPRQPPHFPQCNNFYPTEESEIDESFTYKPYDKDANNEITFNEISDNYFKISSHTASINSSTKSINLKLTKLLSIIILVFYHLGSS
ncbi:UNVERIFIED_CONTAM: hypothetical protein PYX00_002890 [Menopon gallinae]|uniref:Laccase n=1 Tax=Menopon gallinae TaxID=328185 RepID=A0AAW2HXX7_9NEOP